MANAQAATPAVPPPKPKISRRYAGKVQRILKLRERGKLCYERADVLFKQLRLKLGTGAEILLKDPPGKKAVIVDNYEKEDKCFRAHGINRYELKVEKAEQL